MQKDYTQLSINTYFSYIDKTFNLYHEFSHAAFVTLTKNELIKINIRKKDCSGECTFYNSKRNNLYMMLIYISGVTSNLFYNKYISNGCDRTDIEKVVEIFNNYNNSEILSLKNKLDNTLTNIELTKNQKLIISEYVNSINDRYLNINDFLMNKTAFHCFIISLLEFIFKIFISINHEFYELCKMYENRNFITRKGSKKIVRNFEKMFYLAKVNDII